MSNARNFMILAAAFLLFIGACTYAAGTVRAVDDAAKLAYNLNAENDRKVKTALGAPGDELYSGAQVVYMIRNIADGEADIEVDGVLFPRCAQYEDMDPAVVALNKTYRAVYRRDAAGYLTKIVFRS
ncbi:hypothetical protein QWJ34_23985 [Saccharibacillus sp. CPCC 101409]|uniref:hypothetical protein n=1 Tax=Saccharibacillus sp. CPCC 101409 TaxID=3058041 RepID=UPI002673D661|nr:hypothetical protein [Saccharibacillus sp. CPCC 101409]MDO3412848.1 hypothetical protein [Saccharibacillus sp. CPCC 101409]